MSPFVNWSFLQAETPPTQTAGAKGGSVKVYIPLALKLGESGPQKIFFYVFLIKFLKSGLGWNCQPCFLLSFQNSEAVKILYNMCHLIMLWLKRENKIIICLISSTLWLQVSQNSSSSVKTFFDGQWRLDINLSAGIFYRQRRLDINQSADFLSVTDPLNWSNSGRVTCRSISPSTSRR